MTNEQRQNRKQQQEQKQAAKKVKSTTIKESKKTFMPKLVKLGLQGNFKHHNKVWAMLNDVVKDSKVVVCWNGATIADEANTSLFRFIEERKPANLEAFINSANAKFGLKLHLSMFDPNVKAEKAPVEESKNTVEEPPNPITNTTPETEEVIEEPEKENTLMEDAVKEVKANPMAKLIYNSFDDAKMQMFKELVDFWDYEGIEAIHAVMDQFKMIDESVKVSSKNAKHEFYVRREMHFNPPVKNDGKQGCYANVELYSTASPYAHYSDVKGIAILKDEKAEALVGEGKVFYATEKTLGMHEILDKDGSLKKVIIFVNSVSDSEPNKVSGKTSKKKEKKQQLIDAKLQKVVAEIHEYAGKHATHQNMIKKAQELDEARRERLLSVTEARIRACDFDGIKHIETINMRITELRSERNLVNVSQILDSEELISENEQKIVVLEKELQVRQSRLQEMIQQLDGAEGVAKSEFSSQYDALEIEKEDIEILLSVAATVKDTQEFKTQLQELEIRISSINEDVQNRIAEMTNGLEEEKEELEKMIQTAEDRLEGLKSEIGSATEIKKAAAHKLEEYKRAINQLKGAQNALKGLELEFLFADLAGLNPANVKDSVNALKTQNVTTVKELAVFAPESLQCLKGVGSAAIRHLRSRLSALGFVEGIESFVV